MGEVYIVEACRSPIGKRGKGLAGMKPADLLGAVQQAALDRSGIEPGKIGKVVGGCVSQVGEQTFNIARIAWLSQGLPLEVAATTIDAQCGSSQQATSMGASLIGAGIEDLEAGLGARIAALAGSVESPVITRARHREKLTRGLAALASAKAALDQELGFELVAEDLRLAIREMQSIVGEIGVEDVLGAVFSRFCIGK